MDAVTIFYADDAYVELPAPGQPHRRSYSGLMGRRVAGHEFLEALLRYGHWKELVALVADQSSSRTFEERCQNHPAFRGGERKFRSVPLTRFHRHFFPTPPAPQLYLSQPLDSRFAWVRQQGGGPTFAMSGVTYTICSSGVVQMFTNMVTAPYYPFDALICASRAGMEMVKAVTDNYCDFLRESHGGNPRNRVRLEVIPLGVDTDKYRPPTPQERANRRKLLGIADDEVAVLFVGRMSFHAKAHPFPMYAGLAEAARRTGKKVYLMVSGEPPNQSVLQAFLDGARLFAPNIRMAKVESTSPDWRTTIWHAADIFTSLSDNLQETFGLSVVEGLASGLPVVASDWDGYRDLVVDGETGFLVPTYLVQESMADLTARHLLEEMNYDHFIATAAQAAVVDVGGAADAYARLLADPALRQRLGHGARQRALQVFSWEKVIQAYEELWDSQEKERQEYVRTTPLRHELRWPTIYPAPEYTFASWPTRVLDGNNRVQAVAGAEAQLPHLLAFTLTNFSGEARCNHAVVLSAVLSAAEQSCTVAQLDAVFEQAGVPLTMARATLAWLLKYNALRLLPA